RPALTPSVDALQEFKIQQNANSAAYGDGTAIINSALRSGTNEFHGDVWEFLRNNALDARGFFDRSVPPLRRNQFGFTAGGPIRRNRTFFFANYEGLRTRRTNTQYALIPTPAQLAGDFGGSATIYDPATLDAAGKRQPFARNVVPAGRLSQFDKAAKNLYPQPNLTGVAGYNYAKTVANPENADQVNFKVDHQFSTSDSFFARFSKSTDNTQGYSYPLPYSGTISDVNGLQALAHETHIFTPT